MDACINHPDHAAIEHCEVCGNPLCDLCLWYADDGRRLCETHALEHQAQGGTVQSPEKYEGGIRVREVDERSVSSAPYQGNQTDLFAAVGVVIGAAAVLSYFGGTYCMPILALALGVSALSASRKAMDPDRTRTLGVLGVVLGFLGIVPILFFFCFSLFMTALAFGAAFANP